MKRWQFGEPRVVVMRDRKVPSLSITLGDLCKVGLCQMEMIE